MKLIAGLGNPGKLYNQTRHNVGFLALDALAKKLGLKWETSKKLKAISAKNADIILLKPQTFMNNSGLAVAAALAYYKLGPENLTVIHDDLDIPLGKYKISTDSRSAGHKGVESIIDRLKTKNFKRIRIGVKTSELEKIPADKFVLQKFASREKKTIQELIAGLIQESQ